jgi:hypothetical protein
LIYPQQRAGGFFFFLAYPALPLLITYFFIFYYLPTFRHFISPFHTNNTHPTPPLPTDPPTLITHHLVSYYSPYTPTISNLSTQSLITNNPPKTILLPSQSPIYVLFTPIIYPLFNTNGAPQSTFIQIFLSNHTKNKESLREK